MELFLFAMCLGFTLQTFVLAQSTLSTRHAIWLTAVAFVWTFGAYGIDLLIAVVNDFQIRTDVVGYALLAFLFVFPFYAFFNPHLPQSINRQGVILMLPGTLAINASDQLPWIAITAVAATLLVLLSLLFLRLNTVTRFLYYSVFLGSIIAMTVLEMPYIFRMLNASEENLPGFVAAVVGSSALLYLLFHAWFALKFFLIGLSCTRRQGRDLASSYMRLQVVQDSLPWPIFTACLIVIILLLTGVVLGIVPVENAQLYVLAIVVGIPQVFGIWLRRKRDRHSSSSSSSGNS